MRKTIICAALMAGGTSIPTLATATDVSVNARVSSTAPVERRISDRTYDVKVRGDRNDSRSDVYDEALYKAARKTRKKDYDWFRVIDSEVERETRITDSESGFEAGYERVPYQSCGLLTCRTEYRTETRSRLTIDAPEREESRYTVELEFEAGWGSMPRGGEVYDARRVENEYR